MGAGLCAEIEEEKEEGNRGEEGAQYSLDSYSQLTDFPKSRRWEEKWRREKCLHFVDTTPV